MTDDGTAELSTDGRGGAVGTVADVERFRPYPVAVLSAVTLFIWVNRVWLAWTQDVPLAEKLGQSIPITIFVVAAAALLVAQVRGSDPASAAFVLGTRILAGGTIAYWAIRLPMILSHDHGAGFKVVHTVLAVASVAASIPAWRAVGRSGGGRAGEPEVPESHDAVSA